MILAIRFPVVDATIWLIWNFATRIFSSVFLSYGTIAYTASIQFCCSLVFYDLSEQLYTYSPVLRHWHGGSWKYYIWSWVTGLKSNIYYRHSIYRGHTPHGNAHNPTETMIKLLSDFSITDDTPYLTLTGELWGVFREFIKENDRNILERTVLQKWKWKKTKMRAPCAYLLVCTAVMYWHFQTKLWSEPIDWSVMCGW